MSNRATLTDTERQFVQHMRVARLATADEHGSPHLIPVCYAFDNTRFVSRFYIALDEKPKRVASTQLRRVRNIEARHEASLLIDQYDDDWSKLGYVLVHGHAELIGPDHEAHTNALKLLRARYVQYRAMMLETQPIIVVTPDHVVSWGPALNE
jgi:PPOX class probable F420-dependent enzyme